ncbi:MAG: pilus assembly protein PilM [Desulfobacterales bacterium]|nr:pilus assembly protein PilM [Desulfobacterales bacterium]
MLFQTSIGIYIKEDCITIVCLKGSFKGVKLAACKIHSLENEIPLKERLKIIRDLTKDFIKQNKIASPNIFLGIPRELTIFRNIEFPLAVKENLRSTMTYEMEKYIPISVDNIYFDCQVVTEDKTGNRLGVLLVAAKKETISPFLELAELLGNGISGIEICSTAMANYFSSDPETASEKEYAFIYPDNGSLELCIIKEKLLAYSVLIRAEGDGKDIPGFIMEKLKPFIAARGKEEDTLKLVYCAASSENGLLEQLKAEDDIDAYPVKLSGTGIPSCDLLPAFGLALKGLRKVPAKINLLPQHLRKKLNKNAYYLMIVLAGLAILTCLIWGGSRLMRQRFILNSLNAEIKVLVSEAENIDRIKARSREIGDRIDYLNTVLLGKVPFIDLLRELSRIIPESAWIQNLKYSDNGLQLDGHAASASELIPLLEDSPLFEEAGFLSTITKGNDGKEKFKIGLKISSQH